MKSISRFPIVNPVFEDEDTIIIRSIKESEYIRKEAPSNSDIKKTKRFLKDFGIKKIEIPDFVTLAELQRWQRDLVFTVLESY